MVTNSWLRYILTDAGSPVVTLTLLLDYSLEVLIVEDVDRLVELQHLVNRNVGAEQLLDLVLVIAVGDGLGVAQLDQQLQGGGDLREMFFVKAKGTAVSDHHLFLAGLQFDQAGRGLQPQSKRPAQRLGEKLAQRGRSRHRRWR